MTKQLYSLLLFLVVGIAGHAQVSDDYIFFKGDTLEGFDEHAHYTAAMAAKISLSDMPGYLHAREVEFVEHKYNLGHSLSTHRSLPVNPVLTSTCNNLDFENGNYTGWTGGIGYNTNSTLALTQTTAGISTLGANSAETSCSAHTLVNTGTDPYSLLPMVDPGGGTWAVRLGGENYNMNNGSIIIVNGVPLNCTGNASSAPGFSNGEFLQQTFMVTPANAMFTYKYVVILEQTSGGHTATQCPYFRAEVLDKSGNPIPCLQYYVESDSVSIPTGMFVSQKASSAGSQVYYSNWTANSLNLKNYINQNVTIRFSAAGCTLGGHFGYAYVDASCGPVEVLSSSPEVCAGGSVTLTAPGAGTGTYSWTTVPPGGSGIVGSTTGQSVTINAAGTYEITVTQAPGCSYTIDTTIAFYPNPVVTVTSTNATCSPGHDGTATATVTAGDAPYTYAWSPSGGTNATATGLGAGTYVVTITTKDGCTTTGTATITQPPGAPTITLTSTPATCSPGGDGTVTATVTGGQTPYTYSWSPGNPTGQGTNAITGLNGGTYVLTVTTPNVTCPATATVVVTQPGGPSASAVTTDVTCFGLSDGSATITATGGSTPLAYSWSPNTDTNPAATGLAAGTYTCTTTDSKGCAVPTVVVINQPALLSLTASGTNATCNGICNGGLICVPVRGGGTLPYVYSWSSGCQLASCTGVCAGTYTATVTDAHGCKATDTITIGQPTALALTIQSTPSHCGKPDGKDSATVSGGTPGYTYTWTPTGGSSNFASGLAAGNYTLLIHDANHCADSIHNIVPNLPGVNIVLDSTRNVTCFGRKDGQATVSASGGFPAYTYQWIPSGQTTPTATGLGAGTYTCTVTDSAGCTNHLKTTILQPPLLSTSTSPSTICLTGCTNLVAQGAGGTPGYLYSWSLNGTATAVHVCPLVTTTYTVLVTDTHGCTVIAQEKITVNPALEVIASGTKSICPGGSAQLGAVGSGGNGGPYSYLWTPATGLSNPGIPNPVANPTVTTTYTVIVSDNCGTPTDSDKVTVTVFPAPVVKITSKDSVVCGPDCLTFTAISTPACFTATWTFGDGTSATGCNTAHHCYPTQNTYTITYTMTDINGCPGAASLKDTVKVLPYPVADFTAGPQPTTILDPLITFTDESTGSPVSWTWTFGDPGDSASFLQNPNHSYLDTGCFNVTLHIVAADGCTDQITKPVCIEPYFTFFAPNTFTPNGDGKNDVWMPYGVGIDPNNYDLIMFDRWGNLMFETHVWGEGWDGRANHGENIAQIDTYVWKVVLKDVFHNKHEYIGHCNIIR